ncbi:uncharacterized protein LOC144101620 [Amblyomma americanum]
MSHFKLDLHRMTDDPKEDPLDRMIELSLDYGLDSPVSFSRKYNVTGEASAPFAFEITLNAEVKEFLSALQSLDEEDIEDFYQLLLSRYALLNDSDVAKHLMDADDEIADFLNETADNRRPSRLSIADLANFTAVTTDRWRELLSRFLGSVPDQYDYVDAIEEAVVFLAYLSQPSERLGMRRVLAWHVLRYLVGPKEDFLCELNRSRGAGDIPDDNVFIPTPEGKCGGLVAKVSGVPYRSLDLLEGADGVPIQTIADMTHLMAEFQDAVASVFREHTCNTTDATAIGNVSTAAVAAKRNNVALFPGKTHSRAHRRDVFTAFSGSSVCRVIPKRIRSTALRLCG